MKKTGKLTRIIAATLLFCMIFALTSCLDAVGGLRVKTFSVERTSVKTEYVVGDKIDFSGIKVNVTYSDESLNTVYTFNDVTITYANDITETTGTKTVKVSMIDPHTNEKKEDKVTITVKENEYAPVHERYEIDSSEMKTTYIIGETIDFTGLKVYEVFKNKDKDTGEYVETPTLLEDAEKLEYVYNAETFTATAGNKQIKVKYDGNDVGVIDIRINNPEVEIVEIVSIVVGGSYDTSCVVGKTPDFTGITVTVTYADETVEVLEFADLTIDPVDTSVITKKTVTISFIDPVNNEEATSSFQIDVIADKLTAVQFEKSSTITSFESDNKTTGKHTYSEAGFSGEFIEGGKLYVIGDDNGFTFKPSFAVNENGVPKSLTNYYADVDLYIYENSEYKALDKTVSGNEVTYKNGETVIATVNTLYHTYDFTDEAVGAQIKISVLPSEKYYKLDNIGTNPVTLETKIIDAYNVTEAWQLAVIDNYQIEWTAIKNRRGIAGYAPAGIVLHNDIFITADEAENPELDVVPRDFFFKTTREITYVNGNKPDDIKVIPAGTKYLEDVTEVYHRTSDSSFVIEGNFFNISITGFPIIASPAVFGKDADKDYGADYSNAALFRFETTAPEFGGNAADYNSKVTINNVSFIGNAARDNYVDEAGDLVSAGGLILLKSSEYTETTFNNTLANSFFITYFPDRTGTVIVNNSKCYDSYQNAAFVYGAATLNLNNSFINGAGGPLVIASSCLNDVEDANGNTIEEDIRFSPTVNVVGSILESHLSGEELWFSAVSATTMVGSIKALGAGLEQAGLGNFIDGSGKMNIYGLIMNSGTSAAEAIGSPDTEGTYVIDGDGIERWKTDPLWNAIINSGIYTTVGANGMTPPFFCVNDAEGNVYYLWSDGSNFYDLSGKPLGTDASHLDIMNAFKAADTLTLSQGGMSIVLEFYH